METSLDKTGGRSLLASVDWAVVAIYLILLVCGWFSICGASHEIGDTNFFAWDTRTGKQLVWMGCAMVLGFFLLMLDDRYFDTLAAPAYWAMMLLLLVTPFVASDIKGSYSWIRLGSVSIQPAEFAKCTTALALAKLVNQYGFTLDKPRNLAKAAMLVLLPMVLIVMQRETGSALVYLAFSLMFYREGMAGSILFTGAAAVIYFVVGIRFGEMELPGTHATVGEFAVLTLAWLFTTGMVRVYAPSSPHARRLLVWGGTTLAVGLCVSVFIGPFDIAWVLIAICVGAAVYLAFQALDERWRHCLLISVFALGSVAFLYSSDYVLNNVGATLPCRDAVDQRIIEEVRTGKPYYVEKLPKENPYGDAWGLAEKSQNKDGYFKYRRMPNDSYKLGIITSPAQMGGLPEYKGTPYVDTDGDGMPDEWEKANGLNPNDPSDANEDCTGDGYTNIEKYINGISTKNKIDWTDLKNNYDTLAEKGKLM